MKIDFGGGESLLEKHLIKKVIKTCLKGLKQPLNVELSFSFLAEEDMKELNARTRSKDAVTDVLSFPAQEITAGQKAKQDVAFLDQNIFLGDIVVCKPQILRQAKEYGNTYKEELSRMVLHSCLHLLGYDHIDPKDEEVMRAVEAPLYKKITGKI